MQSLEPSATKFSAEVEGEGKKSRRNKIAYGSRYKKLVFVAMEFAYRPRVFRLMVLKTV